MESQVKDGPPSEHDFFEYMGFDPEPMRRARGFYVPMFDGKDEVLDLACGRGEFRAIEIRKATRLVSQFRNTSVRGVFFFCPKRRGPERWHSGVPQGIVVPRAPRCRASV